MRAILVILCSIQLGWASSAAGAIRTPEDWLGHRVGADRKLADWETIVGYLDHLSAESPRIHVERLGRSTQGRPFVLVVVADAEGIERRDELRAASRRLYDAASLEETDAREISSDARAIVAFSLGLHSTEVGASQASMEMLYTLATREDELFQQIRRELLMLFVPSMNPDGLDIIVDWYRETVGTDAEGSYPPWLYHHYAGHDNNRDGFFNNLDETRLWSKLLYHDWLPQVVIDEHQMGNRGPRLFLPPFDDPISSTVHPLVYTQLAAAGQQVVSELTADGHSGIVTSTTFTGEWPGSVRSTGFWHNMLGILSEVASVRLATPLHFPEGSLSGIGRGLPAYERRANFLRPWEGGWWRLRDIVDLELDLTWAFLRWASTYREDLLLNFWRMNHDAIETGRNDAPYGFVIGLKQHDRSAPHRLSEILHSGGVELSTVDGPFEVEGRSYPDGALVVSAAQPFRPFLLEMLRSPSYPRVREWGTDQIVQPYDVTAWDLRHLLEVQVQELQHPSSLDELALEPLGGPIEGQDASVTGPWTSLSTSDNASYEAAFHAVARGIEVRHDAQGFYLSNSDPDAVQGLLQSSHAQMQGSMNPPDEAEVMEKLTVGLYSPWGGSMDEGWTRLVLDRYGIEHERLRPDDIAIRKAGEGQRLRRQYDVILFASIDDKTLTEGSASKSETLKPLHETQWPENYRGGMGQGVAGPRLREFAEAGGVVIAFDDSTPWLVEEMGLPVRVRLVDSDRSEFYAPGTLLHMVFDANHPIAWGMPERGTAYFARGKSFEPIAWTEPTAVVARYASDKVLAAGFLQGEERVAGKPALVEVPVGRGKVVLFGFSPQRRAQTEMTFKLVFNSLRRQGD